MFQFDPATSEILRETVEFYSRVTRVYRETGYDKSYALNTFWGGESRRKVAEIIRGPGDAAAKMEAVHRTFLYSINTDDEATKNLMIDWYLELLPHLGLQLDGMDLSFQESPFSSQRNAAQRGDRMLAPDFLRTLVLVNEIACNCRLPQGRFSVLELGAGYGGLARTFRLWYPNVTYVIVDIPETLFFSALFLRVNFPRSNVLMVTDHADLARPLDEYDYVFVPTMFAHGLEGARFELFCNTASMGEMKNAVIREWMDFVQHKVEVRYSLWVESIPQYRGRAKPVVAPGREPVLGRVRRTVAVLEVGSRARLQPLSPPGDHRYPQPGGHCRTPSRGCREPSVRSPIERTSRRLRCGPGLGRVRRRQ